MNTLHFTLHLLSFYLCSVIISDPVVFSLPHALLVVNDIEKTWVSCMGTIGVHSQFARQSLAHPSISILDVWA